MHIIIIKVIYGCITGSCCALVGHPQSCTLVESNKVTGCIGVNIFQVIKSLVHAVFIPAGGSHAVKNNIIACSECGACCAYPNCIFSKVVEPGCGIIFRKHFTSVSEYPDICWIDGCG